MFKLQVKNICGHMQMYHTFKVLLITLLFVLPEIYGTPFLCTLEDMKKEAARACQDMFKANAGHINQKREISVTTHHAANNLSHQKVKVRKKDYPAEGYIVVSYDTAKWLRKLVPDYKIVSYINDGKSEYSKKRKIGKAFRRRRSNISQGEHLLYCCLEKCNARYFC